VKFSLNCKLWDSLLAPLDVSLSHIFGLCFLNTLIEIIQLCVVILIKDINLYQKWFYWKLFTIFSQYFIQNIERK